MKITLISPYPDITAFGLRTLSAYLSQKDYDTIMIFLPDPRGDEPDFSVRRYKDHVLDQVVDLCEQSDLIGITVMTNFFANAIEITESIKKKLSCPVIWGGIHPTIRPEESLAYADMVCVGDGEEAILELADNIRNSRDFSNIRNLHVKAYGKIIKNPVRELCRNPDIFPAPDYRIDHHLVMHEDRLELLDAEMMKYFMKNASLPVRLKKIGYQTMTGRGCPHQCAYCVNDAIKNLYRGQQYLRWRSADSVIKELAQVKSSMPFINFIQFSDDAFLGRKLQDIKCFCDEYKERINLPFSVLASPLTVTEEKLETLVGAGLIFIQMGIQSGSSRMLRLFNRSAMSPEKVIEAIGILNRFKDRIYPPCYDFILDTPYETERDKIDTLELISEIPKPFHLQLFRLVLFPGTKLHQVATEDGYITDERRQIYSQSYYDREHSYLNLLMTLAKAGLLPAPLLKFLLHGGVVKVLNSGRLKPFFRFFYKSARIGYRSIRSCVKSR